MAGGLKTQPWTVRIEGEIKTPQQFSIDDLLKIAPLEERIYRLRYVEGWSMVIPWIGFPLVQFIKKVQPTSKAQFVEFTSLADKSQMPGVRSRVLDWPHVEGLRIDKAMHPLTLLTFGMYGSVMPNQTTCWQYLHKLVYLIIALGLLYFFWMKAGKHDFSQPILFVSIIALLFALRIGWVLKNRTLQKRRN